MPGNFTTRALTLEYLKNNNTATALASGTIGKQYKVKNQQGLKMPFCRKEWG